MAKQLQLIVGRRLSQFSVSKFALRLAFWGEDSSSVGHEVQVEHETLELVEFEGGLMIGVDPDERYEFWQISSDDGLLIVCAPGGELTIWYPENLG